jgi:signal transduction histidine kinase
MTTPEKSVREEEVPRLLFVAGERETQRVLERLRGTGLEVSSERVSTPEALKAALEQPWDVAVCGTELAGLGFREAASLLREKDPSLAFLVLTPRWEEAEMRAALEAGAHGYLDMERLAQVALEVRREAKTAVERREYQHSEGRRQRRSEFLASLNHEVRSPLNGIIGYCDLLMHEEGSQLTSRGRNDLEVVKKSAQALLALINDMLDLLRLEAGRVDVVRELVNFRELAEDCTSTVRMYLSGKDVALKSHIDERMYLLQADELKLRQVLFNLLSHAARSTHSGEITLTARAEGKEAVFLVDDTGGGIPADQLPFIFEKLQHLDDASARKTGSSVLGLTLVKELTEVMGGSVSVQSTQGRGTTFTVRLPGVVED